MIVLGARNDPGLTMMGELEGKGEGAVEWWEWALNGQLRTHVGRGILEPGCAKGMLRI